MIIARAPFRISLGGGGTDLPFYANHKGGSLITAAINHYAYVSLHRRHLDKLIWLSYSNQETQEQVDNIQHSLIREALRMVEAGPSVEIHSIPELSGQVGLGGSSAFLVALLLALYSYKGMSISKEKLAQEATHIERIILQNHGGIQDQYISSYGGFRVIENDSLTSVKVYDLSLSQDVIDRLSENLLLFYTGVKRNSSAIIQAQKEENLDKDIISFYDKIKEIGYTAKQALFKGDLEAFGKTFHEHWMLKKELAKEISNDNFDLIYNKALQNGAIGGKIVGAGGGGFFMFYVPGEHARFCDKMKELGMIQIKFNFDFEGAVTVFNENNNID